MTTSTKIVLAVACLAMPALLAIGQDADSQSIGDGWLDKSDPEFAADFANTAFNDSL